MAMIEVIPPTQSQEDGVPMSGVLPDPKEMPSEKITGAEEADKEQLHGGRRRSKRLMKEIAVTTMEKNEKMARKHNLEGNCSSHNMFSTLPVEEVAEISSCMGVSVDKNDFETFDLLKNLENTRYEMFKKQKENTSEPQTETVETTEQTGSPLPIEWVQEEFSDTEDFVLVLSKKKARELKKSKLASSVAKKK